MTNGKMALNPLGIIAHETWLWLEQTFPIITIEEYCIMPNHAHALITIHDPTEIEKRASKGGSKGEDISKGALLSAPTSAPTDAPTSSPRPKPLGRIIGAYKTHSTVLINKHLKDVDIGKGALPSAPTGSKFWQRSFHDHIVRNEKSFHNIARYIQNNPAQWEEDVNHKT